MIDNNFRRRLVAIVKEVVDERLLNKMVFSLIVESQKRPFPLFIKKKKIMKKRIPITESQLNAIIRDVVNEMFRGGENWDVVDRAAYRMFDKGQKERSMNLFKAYKDLNDTDDVEYSTMGMAVKTPDGQSKFRYDAETDFLGANPDDLRGSDRKRARHIADRLKKMNPKTQFTKDDFIAESVTRKLKRLIG